MRNLNLDLARLQGGVALVGIAAEHFTPHSDDVLAAQAFGQGKKLPVALTVEDQLNQPGAVAQIDKEKPAMIATALHPAPQGQLFAGIAGAQLPATRRFRSLCRSAGCRLLPPGEKPLPLQPLRQPGAGHRLLLAAVHAAQGHGPCLQLARADEQHRRETFPAGIFHLPLQAALHQLSLHGDATAAESFRKGQRLRGEALSSRSDIERRLRRREGRYRRRPGGGEETLYTQSYPHPGNGRSAAVLNEVIVAPAAA